MPGPLLVASLLEAYPFAFSINPDYEFHALGSFFRSRHPHLEQCSVADVLTLVKPSVDDSLSAYIESQRNLAEPSIRVELLFTPPALDLASPGVIPFEPRPLRLAGAFLACGDDGMSLFLGTMAASEIRHMAAHGLTVGDFGPIDPSPEFAMMAEVNAGMLADSQIMNEQLRRSRDEALAAKRELEKHRELLEELVDERTGTIKRQAAQLEEALKQEKHLSELQRSFVSMTSHEFRTPLAIIDGNAQKIERNITKMSSGDIAERVKRIRRAVVSMQSVMESTLSAAKMEAGKVQIQPRLIDLRTILQECCDARQELSVGHRIELDLASAPAQVTADPSSVSQIVTNLLSNAVKYSPEADRVDVRLCLEQGSALISVQDYGLGIDEDEQKNIFTRFFRARTSAGIPGTGIGLNLSKMLAEEQGGSITISSKKGKGSTFTLRLPLKSGEGERDTSPETGVIPSEAANREKAASSR